MNRRRKTKSGSKGGLGRLFLWTTVLAIIFGLGLILGQRMLLEDNLRPLVSTGDATPSLSAVTQPSTSTEDDDEERADLFSFYEALTASDIEEVAAPVAIADAPVDRRATAGVAEETTDGDQPHTDDGSEPARYTLQIASHPTMERARTEMDRLRALDLDPHVVAAEVPGQGKYYRVRIGKFPSEDQARAYRAQVESDLDVQTFVTPL